MDGSEIPDTGIFHSKSNPQPVRSGGVNAESNDSDDSADSGGVFDGDLPDVLAGDNRGVELALMRPPSSRHHLINQTAARRWSRSPPFCSIPSLIER